MAKSKNTQNAGYKNLVAIAVIAVSCYFGFDPLFRQAGASVNGAVIGASFGAIFVIVLTMYLLNKQTEIEQNSKRGEKVFEQKIEFYKGLLSMVKDILLDGKLNGQEVNQLAFGMVELQMVGADETVDAYLPVLTKCNEIVHSSEDDIVEVEISDEDKISLLESLSKFSQACRVDLGIDDDGMDSKIFHDALAQISEGVTKKIGNREYFDGLDSKLLQLQEQGYNKDGIESYRILLSVFNEKSLNSDRYRVNLAKSGSAFYDSKAAKQQQIYSTNPQKRASGIGIYVKESSGLVDQVNAHVLGLLGKEHSDNVTIQTELKGRKIYDLYLHNALADEMGVAKYHELLAHISQQVLDVCEKRTG